MILIYLCIFLIFLAAISAEITRRIDEEKYIARKNTLLKLIEITRQINRNYIPYE